MDLFKWRVTINYANSVEDMKSPKEDYEIWKEWWRTNSSSSPLFFSLFIIYLYLEAINVILKWWPRRDPCFVKQGIFVFSLVILSAREFLQLRGADKWPISVTSAYCTQCKTDMEFLFASFSINISELKKLNVSKYS